MEAAILLFSTLLLYRGEAKEVLLNMSGFSSRLKLPPIFCVNWSIDNQLFNPNLWYKLCDYCSCSKPCDNSEYWYSEVLRWKWKVFSFSKWFLGAQHLPPSKLSVLCLCVHCSFIHSKDNKHQHVMASNLCYSTLVYPEVFFLLLNLGSLPQSPVMI